MGDLEAIYKPIERELARTRDFLSGRIVADDSPAAAILRSAGHASGKLLRPALVLLSGKGNGPLGEAHGKAAAAIELIHRASLLHDDVLDGASIRRGGPTTNTTWGNELSVLAGDVLLAHAFKLVTQLPDPAAFQIIADAARRTCEGEIRQLLSQRNLTTTEQDCFKIAEEKTASLWAAACHVGALLGGRPAEDAEQLRQYGLILGTAFQIADDCIDVTDSEADAGKTLGTDLRNGRYTLPVVHLIATAPDEARKLLGDAADCSDEPQQARHAARIRDSLRTHGSLRYAATCAANLARDASSKLRSLPSGPSRESLEALADHVIGSVARAQNGTF